MMAEDGTDALEKIHKKPDIILLDINMPKIDGLEVCRRIRGKVTCPIIFLTAKVEEQDRVNGLLSGIYCERHGGKLLIKNAADGGAEIEAVFKNYVSEKQQQK